MPKTEAQDSGGRRRPIPPRLCKVDGCGSDLGGEKLFYRRGRCCSEHAMLLSVLISSKLHRFCQKCCAFHSDLSSFDGVKKSCRRRLAEHNARRQNDNRTSNTARRAASAAAAAATAAAYNGGNPASALPRRSSTSAQLADAAFGPALGPGNSKGSSMTAEDHAIFQEFGGRSGRPQRACKAAAVRALAAAAEADSSSGGGGAASEDFEGPGDTTGLSENTASGADSRGNATAASEPTLGASEHINAEPERRSMDSVLNHPPTTDSQYVLCDFMLEVPPSVDLNQGIDAPGSCGNSGQTHADNGLLQYQRASQGSGPTAPLLWCDATTQEEDLLPSNAFEHIAQDSPPHSALRKPMTLSARCGSSTSSAAVLHMDTTERGSSVPNRSISSTAMHTESGLQWMAGAGAPFTSTISDPSMSYYSSCGGNRGAGGSSLPKISHGSNGSASALYSSQSLDTTDSQMIQQPRGPTDPLAVRARHRGTPRKNRRKILPALQMQTIGGPSNPSPQCSTFVSCSPAAELQSLLPAGIEWDSHQAMEAAFPTCGTQHQHESGKTPSWFDESALQHLQPPALIIAEEPPLLQLWQDFQQGRQQASMQCDADLCSASEQSIRERSSAASPEFPAIPSWANFNTTDDMDTTDDFQTEREGFESIDARLPLPMMTQQFSTQELQGNDQEAETVPSMPSLPPSLQCCLQQHREHQFLVSFGSLPSQRCFHNF